MKRDMSLIRKLVLAIEDCPGAFSVDHAKFADVEEKAIKYHLYLLVKGGLAEGVERTHGGSGGIPEALVTHLTWAGHDFADASRNETIWNQAIKTIKDKAGAASFKILGLVLSHYAKKYIGI